MVYYKHVLHPDTGKPLLDDATGLPKIYDADLYPDGPPDDCCCGDCCESLPETLCATREWLTGCLAGTSEDFELIKSAPGVWDGTAPGFGGNYTFSCESEGGVDDWVLSSFGCPSTGNVKHVEIGATCNPVFAEFLFTYAGSDFACPTMSCGFMVAGSYKVTVQNCPEMLMAMAARVAKQQTMPGTILKTMLKEIDAKAYEGCGCEDMVLQMNDWGPEGCRANRATIVDRLRENKDKLNLGQLIKISGKVLMASWRTKINPRDPLGSLVDEAIRRSEAATSEPS